jgi:prepilin-type N-terminal cleavage/methylation domain-containing protein
MKPTPAIKGFTLIEMLLVIALTALMMLTVNSLIVYFYKTNNYTLQQSFAANEARQGVQDAMTYLRGASYGADGSYPIASAATSSITFYAAIGSSNTIDEISYQLIKGTLYRLVTAPAGNPPSYAGQQAASSTIAVSVVNDASTPVFQYFDNTGTLLTSPINIAKIASVTTSLIIDVDVNRAPVAFTLTGGATLRNLLSQ